MAVPGPGEDANSPEPSAPNLDPCSAAGLLWCETFEADASGTYPGGSPWQAELPGCGTHVVDELGSSLSGSKALRADAGGYPECMLHADLTGEEDLFVRSSIRLGPEPELLSEYFSLIEWGPRQDQDEPELRVGVRPGGGSLCATSPGIDVTVTGLAGGPATECTGFTLEPERWYCVQAHLTRDESGLAVSLTVDGELLMEQQYTRLTPGWDEGGLFLKLGRAAYGASAGGALWHDDVAVGREPLPCPPSRQAQSAFSLPAQSASSVPM